MYMQPRLVFGTEANSAVRVGSSAAADVARKTLRI
jgi:hypothetical protein